MRLLTTTALAALIAIPAAAQDWKDDYRTIRFGILSGENEQDRIARNEPLKSYLEGTLGVEVEIFTAGNYDGVVQAMAADQIEFARFGSSSYAAVYTETDGGVEPLLTGIRKDGSTGYYSTVVTRCEDGYAGLADLEGKIHAFADPDSTSGYAVPYFNMVKQGFEPKEYFAAIPFSGSHEAGVQGVVNGTFDSASTYQDSDEAGIYQRMVEKGMIEAGIVCPIWESPEITSGPWTARGNLPEGLVDAFTQAMMAFPETDPEGFAEVESIDAEDTNPEVGYVAVDHERYQWIVDMRDWLKQQRRDS